MSEESLFSEVDEELRRDRLRALWRRFGPFVIGAAIAVVALVGVNEGWRWWTNTNAAQSSDLLYKALDAAKASDDTATKDALDAVIGAGTGDYPLLARFAEAGLLAKQGKNDEAIAAYDAVAADAADKRVRELALLLAAFRLVDTGNVTAVDTRIGGILSESGPLYAPAAEALGLTQYKAGDLEAAQKSFQSIVDNPLAPVDLINRVRLYLAQLTAEGVTPPATGPAPADNPAPDTAGKSDTPAATGN